MKNQPVEEEVRAVPARKRRSCLGCLGRGAIILAGLLVVLLVAGAIYQAVASASDLKKYPPQGELYDLGEYRLHLYCTGEGSPTVILVAGAGSPGVVWKYVQTGIEKSARVCSYDRPGFGWSDPASGLLSPQQVASDLHTLLEAAGIPGPYILVGHSAGGVYSRAFASQYRSDVAGMVFVDASQEGEKVNYPPEWQQLDKVQDSMMAFCRAVSPFGVMRLSGIYNSGAASMDPEMRAAYLSTLYRTGFCRSSAEEVEALALSHVADSPGSLGDLPLIVLTADTSEADMQAQIPAYLKSVVSPEVIRKVFEITRELQQGFVSLSSQGRQVMVPNSAHMMQLDQPGVVIDAILDVLAQVRGE